MKRLLNWLNAQLRIVESDPDANAYYAWADQRLDELAAVAKQRAERRVGLIDRRLEQRKVINHVHAMENCDPKTCRIPVWVTIPIRKGGRRRSDYDLRG